MRYTVPIVAERALSLLGVSPLYAHYAPDAAIFGFSTATRDRRRPDILWLNDNSGGGLGGRMSINEIVPTLALVFSALTLAMNALKGLRGEAVTSQSTRDQIDSIATIVRDTRDDVREINHKLDDHATRLVKCEARLDEYERRISNLESKD